MHIPSPLCQTGPLYSVFVFYLIPYLVLFGPLENSQNIWKAFSLRNMHNENASNYF